MSTADPTAPKRQRRCRTRRREGSKFMRGDVPSQVVDWMKANGWIDQAEAADPDKLGEAASDVLDCVARGNFQPRRPPGVT